MPKHRNKNGRPDRSARGASCASSSKADHDSEIPDISAQPCIPSLPPIESNHHDEVPLKISNSPTNPSALHIDGRTLEGGGQLVRVALCLSALCSIPIHITRIRGNRASRSGSGGLKESHLAALHFLSRSSGARVQGDHVGSAEVTFTPSRKQLSKPATAQADETIKLQRPGSVFLILQAILPYILFSNLLSTLPNSHEYFTLTLHGGTNVPQSMSGEYVKQVLLPTLHRIGLPKVELEVLKRGWAGNASEVGEVRVRIPLSFHLHTNMAPFSLTSRGNLSKISITVIARPESTRQTLLALLTTSLTNLYHSVDLEIVINDDSADQRRLYLMLVAHTSNNHRISADFLGSGRTPKSGAEQTKILTHAVETVVRELKREIDGGGCVDQYMQDQLVLFQALASREGGRSKVNAGVKGEEEGTLHTRTVRWVCERMMGVNFDGEGRCNSLPVAKEGAEILEHGKDKEITEELHGMPMNINAG